MTEQGAIGAIFGLDMLAATVAFASEDFVHPVVIYLGRTFLLMSALCFLAEMAGAAWR